MLRSFLAILLHLAFVGPLFGAQTPVGFNVSVQNADQIAVPSPTYSAGSAQFGVWNRAAGPASHPGTYPIVYPLVDINGNATSASFVALNNAGGYWPGDNPATSGDDELLLDQSWGASEGFGAGFQLTGLAPGSYSMYVYVLQGGNCPFSSWISVKNQSIGLGCSGFNGTFYDGGTHIIFQFQVLPGEDISMGLHVTFGDGSAQFQGFQIIPDDSLHKTLFCDSAVNSTGSMANMVFGGTSSVQANDLQLGVRNLPANQFGYFIVGVDPGTGIVPPGSQGNLCIGGAIGRHNRLGEVLFSGPGGTVLMDMDLADIPQPGGAIAVMPGEYWHWQFWYRDNNPSSTSNFSDAYRVAFSN